MARNIVRITVKRLMDEDPDTSYLGEFTDKSHDGVIDRRYDEFVECIDYEVDEPVNVLDRNEYRYFDPYGMGYEIGTKEYYEAAMMNYKRADGLARGWWWMIGIVAEAEVEFGSHNIVQKVSSGGLWGVESDSDKEYLGGIEREQLQELAEELLGLGFGECEIAEAMGNVEYD